MDAGSKVAIIDADSIVWTAAYKAQTDQDYMHGLEYFIQRMLRQVGATHYVGYLGGYGNRRAGYDPLYKANRPAKPDFYHRFGELIRAKLLETWKFELTENGYEADDYVATAATQFRKQGQTFVVCGIDKDLGQIPGEHYNYNTDKTVNISETEANIRLIHQVLIGDNTDNIPGCPGVGPVKAERLIDYIPSPNFSVLSTVAKNAFIEKLGDRQGVAKFAETYLLVRLVDDLPLQVTPIAVPRWENQTGTNPFES